MTNFYYPRSVSRFKLIQEDTDRISTEEENTEKEEIKADQE